MNHLPFGLLVKSSTHAIVHALGSGHEPGCFFSLAVQLPRTRSIKLGYSDRLSRIETENRGNVASIYRFDLPSPSQNFPGLVKDAVKR
mmetsp:Transcript_37846/g.61559  ORF Transcript_37846/g.61559 Transcript_37846/m.61559 type:complete len:88 (+) Transcript_37846:124-387(+)